MHSVGALKMSSEMLMPMAHMVIKKRSIFKLIKKERERRGRSYRISGVRLKARKISLNTKFFFSLLSD